MIALNLSLEEWEDVLNPIWYRFGMGNSTIRTTDHRLARAMGKDIETLGRIERIELTKDQE